MNDLVGETIGPYRISARLGRGGMADVYKAFHTKLEVYRAIKFIRPEFVSSDDFRARFQKEAQGVAKLKHPNIVQIHDFGEDRNRYFMVMEFVEGETLKERLKRNSAFTIAEAVALTMEIAGALKYAHERDLIHRDIKPDNIMIDTDHRPVLMDFGIAKLLTSETQLTQTGVGIGTPAYMAPEQAKGLEVGPPADIYALTIVLYELLTGRVPFSADTPMAVMLKALSDPLPMPRLINPDISEALEAVILKGSAKEPDQRYANVDSFTAALERALHDHTPTSVAIAASDTAATIMRETPAPQGAPTTEPQPKVKATRSRMAIAAITALLGLAAIWWYLAGEPEQVASGPETSAESSGETTSPAHSDRDATSSEAAAAKQAPENERPVVYRYNDEVAAQEVVRSQVPLQKGDVLYLDVIKTGSVTDFTLMTPDGRDKVFAGHSDKGPITIKHSGDHELSFKARRDEAASVDVELLKLPTPIIDIGQLQPGDYLAKSTQWPGQILEGTVSLEKDQVVFLDVVRSEAVTDFSLIGPGGRNTLAKGYSDIGPVTVVTSGEHRWLADPRGDNIADFEIILHVLDPAIIQKGLVQIDQDNSGATQQPGQVVEYTLELNKGDQIYLDVVETSAVTDFSLTAPDGRTQIFKSYSDKGPEEIRSNGQHILRVDPRGENTAQYIYQLHVLKPPVINGGVIETDKLVSGETHQPGQIVAYQISLPNAGPWKFERLSNTSPSDYRLLETDSGVELMKSYSSVKTFDAPGPGTYQLTVDPRNNALSQFSFRILQAEG